MNTPSQHFKQEIPKVIPSEHTKKTVNAFYFEIKYHHGNQQQYVFVMLIKSTLSSTTPNAIPRYDTILRSKTQQTAQSQQVSQKTSLTNPCREDLQGHYS